MGEAFPYAELDESMELESSYDFKPRLRTR